MGRYIVTTGQNIYDIALHIYGSVEGIVDLMMNNPELSLADTLRQGDELIYSDDFIISPDIVAYNRMHNIVPANGERNVYYKEPPRQFPTVDIEILIPNTETATSLLLAGAGEIAFDWGDNTAIEYFRLEGTPRRYSHIFDSSVAGKRKIRIYGGSSITQADLSSLRATNIFFLTKNNIESLTLQKAALSIEFAAMLRDAYRIDMMGLKTQSLLPVIEAKKLRFLDLTDARITRETLDEYLITLVRKYYGRRNCTVTLSMFPSGEYREPQRDEDLNYIISSGMEAVWVILHEPAWNEGGLWEFIIEGETYLAESPEDTGNTNTDDPQPGGGDEDSGGDTPATPI